MNELGVAVATPIDDRATEQLPIWDLDDLYNGPDDPELSEHLDAAQRQAESFRGDYAGRLTALKGAELGEAIARYESILQLLHRVMSFAQLLFASDMSAPEHGRFLQNMQERCNDISTETLFFALKLNRLDDAVIECQLQDAALCALDPR
jgi:oligoendopeptidase F